MDRETARSTVLRALLGLERSAATAYRALSGSDGADAALREVLDALARDHDERAGVLAAWLHLETPTTPLPRPEHQVSGRAQLTLRARRTCAAVRDAWSASERNLPDGLLPLRRRALDDAARHERLLGPLEGGGGWG